MNMIFLDSRSAFETPPPPPPVSGLFPSSSLRKVSRSHFRLLAEPHMLLADFAKPTTNNTSAREPLLRLH